MGVSQNCPSKCFECLFLTRQEFVLVKFLNLLNLGSVKWPLIFVNVFAGVIHLFSAVTSLWTLAKYLEASNRMIRPGFTIPLLFLLSGIAGCLVSANVAFEHNSTGASAAVCGLLGLAFSRS